MPFKTRYSISGKTQGYTMTYGIKLSHAAILSCLIAPLEIRYQNMQNANYVNWLIFDGVRFDLFRLKVLRRTIK